LFFFSSIFVIAKSEEQRAKSVELKTESEEPRGKSHPTQPPLGKGRRRRGQRAGKKFINSL